MSFRLRVVLALALLYLAACSPNPAPASAPENADSPPITPPNVLVIVADDLGWADLDCYGNFLVKSPHLDGLARNGVQFMQAYAAAPTGPVSRATLLTGTARPTPRDRSLADLAHHLGHRTAHLGRWTLAAPPADYGFERSYATQAGSPTSFHHPFFTDNPPADLLARSQPEDYLTDVLTDQCLDVLREWRNEPWLVHLNYYAPHLPLEGRRDRVQFYRDLIDSTHWRRFPVPEYAAMVAGIDENVGRIVSFLDSTDQLANTLVIFTSDNGGLADPVAGHPLTPPTDNGILRGGKGSLYEGGIRVPFIVHYPAYVSERSANRTPVTGADVFPTVAAALGSPTTKSSGTSLLPLLRGGQLPRRTLTWRAPAYPPYPAATAARRDNFKRYTATEQDSTTVFDLEAFPDESTPASGAVDF